MDTTTAANGRIRIKVEKNNVIESISVPGLLKKIAKNYPENIALVSRPEPSGKRISYTYKFVYYFLYNCKYLLNPILLNNLF